VKQLTSIKLFFALIEVSLDLKVHNLQGNIDVIIRGRTVELDIFVGIALVRTRQINVLIQELVCRSVR
jgi:hypothetical protein